MYLIVAQERWSLVGQADMACPAQRPGALTCSSGYIYSVFLRSVVKQSSLPHICFSDLHFGAQICTTIALFEIYKIYNRFEKRLDILKQRQI